MKKRRLVLLAGGIVLIGFALWFTDSEPSYHGRTLNEWAELYSVEGDIVQYKAGGMQGGPASEALDAIGTNALPHLLRWMHYRRMPLRGKLVSLSIRIAGRSVTRRLRKWTEDQPDARAQYALSVFSFLGTNASPAIPELVRMLNEPVWGGDSAHAVLALTTIGGVAALSPLFDASRKDRKKAQEILRFVSMAPSMDLSNSLPFLLQHLQGHRAEAIELAAIMLGQSRLQPDITVPAIVVSITNDNAEVRSKCIDALARFGPVASNAIPRLTIALQDPDGEARISATNALQAIDPELAAKRFSPPKIRRQDEP